MSETIEERYRLDSLDPELETMLEEGLDSVNDRVPILENGRVRCIFSFGEKNGRRGPYEDFDRFLERNGYGIVERFPEGDRYIAELDAEGLEEALRRPYIRKASADKYIS